MSTNIPEMILPESLEADRHLVGPIHERLAVWGLTDMRRCVPDLQREPIYGTGYVVFEPRDYDGKKVEASRHNAALLLPYTFANNNWPNWVLRTRFIQAAIAEACGELVRVIGLPVSTRRRAGGESLRTLRHQSRMAFFDRRELSMIKQGDFNPYAIRHNKILSSLGVKTLDIFGMSYGASLGLADAQFIDQKTDVTLASMGSMDPATLHDKVSEPQIAIGFAGTIKNFFNAVQEGGVPAYTRAQEAAPQYLLGQVLGSVAGTLADISIPELTAAKSGMANGRFSFELGNFFKGNTSTPVLVVGGAGSGVTSAESFGGLQEFRQMQTGQLEVLTLPHGHAVTNHLGYVGICAAKTYLRGGALREKS